MKKPLPFHPRAGQLLVGDFTDFAVPEITKVRPVIVISPRLPFRSGLVTIVPVSTTEPRNEVPYTFQLSRNYAPWGDPNDATWAKCDLVMNVSTARLSSFRVDRRKYISPQITAEDLMGVRAAVLAGLGFIHK